MSVVQENLKSFVEKHDTFVVKQHPNRHRFYSIQINYKALSSFLAENEGVNVHNFQGGK